MAAADSSVDNWLKLLAIGVAVAVPVTGWAVYNVGQSAVISAELKARLVGLERMYETVNKLNDGASPRTINTLEKRIDELSGSLTRIEDQLNNLHMMLLDGALKRPEQPRIRRPYPYRNGAFPPFEPNAEG